MHKGGNALCRITDHSSHWTPATSTPTSFLTGRLDPNIISSQATGQGDEILLPDFNDGAQLPREFSAQFQANYPQERTQPPTSPWLGPHSVQAADPTPFHYDLTWVVPSSLFLSPLSELVASYSEVQAEEPTLSHELVHDPAFMSLPQSRPPGLDSQSHSAYMPNAPAQPSTQSSQSTLPLLQPQSSLLLTRAPECGRRLGSKQSLEKIPKRCGLSLYCTFEWISFDTSLEADKKLDTESSKYGGGFTKLPMVLNVEERRSRELEADPEEIELEGK
ncbi:hypothetical protein BT96DRAFT_971693 [Gymnopus androsaceus JB14]|uniref:Uncharacterized protein n=1 Tax=Gymnopus androsaceus JB14 TaxID=1447944 RepID=A0A6A4IC48_9AGAR|nr:hypothetical protein BT96DRAFT_971693 [Gymnopus androsaceus JB14]